jgi:hypothetical protein
MLKGEGFRRIFDRMVNKKLLWFVMLVGLVSSVFAGPYFDAIVTSFETKFGAGDVTVLNDHQLVYFHDAVWEFRNETTQEIWDVGRNKTINVTTNNPYTRNVYVASIVEVRGSGIYSEAISWGIYE